MDLWGRLSNPPEVVETLAEQGSRASRRVAEDRRRHAESGFRVLVGAPCRRKRDGFQTLSNDGCPTATRRARTRATSTASSIDSLARRSSHRTTVIHHLERRGVHAPAICRKMTDRSVRQAATRYESGESLMVVAARFGVDARTLAREFKRAGVPIRPRRGWPPRL